METVQSRRSSHAGSVGSAVQWLVVPSARGGLSVCRRSARYPRYAAGHGDIRLPPRPRVPGRRPVQRRLPAGRPRLCRRGYRVPREWQGERGVCARRADRIDHAAPHVQLRQPDARRRIGRRPSRPDHVARRPCVRRDRRALRSHHVRTRHGARQRSRQQRGVRRRGRVVRLGGPGNSPEPEGGRRAAAYAPSTSSRAVGAWARRHRRGDRRHRARRQAVQTRP